MSTPRELAEAIAKRHYDRIEQYAPPGVEDRDRESLVAEIEKAIAEARVAR